MVRVRGHEFSPELIAELQSQVDRDGISSRAELGRWLSRRLEWKGRSGAYQSLKARLVLNDLEALKVVQLPQVQPLRLEPAPFDPNGVTLVSKHCSLEALGPIELVAVTSRQRKLSRLWRFLISEYHPLGYSPMAGDQLRYLIGCSEGWLGALGFGAAAWRLQDREAYIGWSEPARRQNLGLVVCNWRFLILPGVRVSGLASHVLSRCVKTLRRDWKQRYSYEPQLLETCVEEERSGSCYRAAGWKKVGTTQGRGRNDRDRQQRRGRKQILLYPLSNEWKKRLCEHEPLPPEPVQPVQPKVDRGEGPDWIQEEFGAARLPDQRLQKRLLIIAADFFARPTANIPEACGSRAKTKAAYRFFGHPELNMDQILSQHRQSTLERIAAEPVALAVQDSTAVSYGERVGSKGLGKTNNHDDTAMGFWLHSTMAYTPSGLPLGLMDVQCWAREKARTKRQRRVDRIPIEQKESRKWLRSFSATQEAQRVLPGTKLVNVGDRESDIYELFVQATSEPQGPRLLVRAKHKRNLEDEQRHLWEHVASLPVGGECQVRIPRRRSHRSRVAHLQVRFCAVTLKAPADKPKLGPVQVWAVYAEEIRPPKKVKAIRWMLLTTECVDTLPSAMEKLQWYAVRWQIEVFHRVIKSGCRIEKRQLLEASRLQHCLAVDLVVGWRIAYMTRLGRDHPDLPCTACFQEHEWKIVYRVRNQTSQLPKQVPTMQAMIRMIAQWGGFLGRKSDGEPGTQTVWLGYQRMQDIVLGFQLGELYRPDLPSAKARDP